MRALTRLPHRLAATNTKPMTRPDISQLKPALETFKQAANNDYYRIKREWRRYDQKKMTE